MKEATKGMTDSMKSGLFWTAITLLIAAGIALPDLARLAGVLP